MVIESAPPSTAASSSRLVGGLDKISGFESALSDPSRSSVSLGITAIEIRAALRQNAGELQAMTDLVEFRKVALEELLARTEAEIKKLRTLKEDVEIDELDDEGEVHVETLQKRSRARRASKK